MSPPTKPPKFTIGIELEEKLGSSERGGSCRQGDVEERMMCDV